MYFIKENVTPAGPVLPPERTLTTRLNAADLPCRYRSLLQERNGGYLLHTAVPTPEPTSDGLDYAHVHYIFGLHEEAEYSLFHQQDQLDRFALPEYFVVFSATDTQLFVFDYSRCQSPKEPSIRYLDIETDNWQTVAPDFDAFLAALIQVPITLPPEGHLTRRAAEHAFLLADSRGLAELLQHTEDTADKEWYFRWLEHFARHPDSSVRLAVCAALETQLLYFHPALPAGTAELLTFLTEDEDPVVSAVAANLQKEL